MATITEPRGQQHWQETDRRVRHPLQAVRGYIRTYVTLEALGQALLYLFLAFWLGLVLDWGLFELFAFDWVQELEELTANQSGAFLLRASLSGIVVLGLVALIVYKMGFRLLREFSDPAMALLLERRFPRQLGDRLITAVELADPRLAKKYGYSLPMIEKTIHDAAERVEQLPVRGVFNWARLKGIFALCAVLSIGAYIVVALAVCLMDVARGGTFAPLGFVGRFNDTAGIWVERNVLLRDAYWPRRAYLELIGFQDTSDHPGEMRVGRDEQRPDLQVRAIEWVRADRHVRGGWRPLLWSDLHVFIPESELAKVNIPSNWPGWIIDLDDLAGHSQGAGVPPESWQGLSSGAIARQLEQPGMKQTLDSAGMTQAVHQLIDWKAWTVDRLAVQLKKDQVRLALRASHLQASVALENILGQLTSLAEEPGMARRLRQLETPESVKVYYRGKTIKNDATSDLQPGNKYTIGLADLKESVRFTVNAADYYTPYKNITLVAPPGLVKLVVDREDPAYIYYRLQGEQTPLKGLKRTLKAQPISVTGDVSIVQVPFGSNVVLHAEVEADRFLKSVYVAVPEKAFEVGDLVPDARIHLDASKKDFSLKLDHVTKTYEFFFEFRDLDNVKGRRRVQIKPADDRPPEILDVELEAVLRKPRFRADAARPAGPGPAAEAFLITPDALLPIKGMVQDDYGLTRIDWLYEVEPVEIELQGDMPQSKPKAITSLAGKPSQRRACLIASGLQFVPGQMGLALTAPGYWAWMSKMLLVDLSLKQTDGQAEGEQRLPLESFQTKLRNRVGEALTLAEVQQKLKEKAAPRELLRKHAWKGKAQGEDFDAFDVKKYLPKLKSADPQRQAQLHYFLKVAVAATDNNVETGPSISKSKTPFLFLIISETELLAQIGLEEELLSDRLEKVYEKLKNAKTILADQLGKLSLPEPKFSEIAIRIDQASKGVTDGSGTTREVLTDYKRIQEELEFNRVSGIKFLTVQNDIVTPLDKITDPTRDGDFPLAEDLFQKLHDDLEDDAMESAKGSQKAQMGLQKRVESMVKTQKSVDELMTKLNTVLVVMQQEVTFAKSLERALYLEQRQRQLAERWRAFHAQKELEILKELLEK